MCTSSSPRRLFAANDQELSECSLNTDSIPFSEKDQLLTDSSWSTDDEGSVDTPRLLPRISLAKISIVVMVIATACDIALSKMSDSPRPKTSLGSAAISSVTETLSPILPFAGGLDLRRDDYWKTSEDEKWWVTLQSVASQVQDAFAQPKQPSQTNAPPASTAAPRKRTNVQHVAVISAQDPFVSLESIAQLTLGEIAETFRHAVESSKDDFNESRFFSDVEPRVKKVINAMNDAVAKSRGDAKEWKTAAETRGSGDVDVLKFCAAMRVFAEWRLLRQVPDGYKGFAVGMSLGHKDVVQNLVKIEEAIHDYIDYQHDLQAECVDTCPSDVYSPTLRELLTYEVETGIQNTQKLPRLKEKSAGMGLLWVRRQLLYQTHVFNNIFNVNDFSSSKDAIAAAYTEVYDKYHGWAVQKIFNYSYKSVPDAEIIFRHMNPHRLQEVLNEKSRSITPKHENSSIGNEENKDENPIEQFLNHVGSEWDKFASNFAKVVLKKDPKMNVRGGGSADSRRGLETDNCDNYVTQEMVKDAHEQIVLYMQVASPLLDDLAALFADLNMNDPKRV